MNPLPLKKALGQHHLRHPELCRPLIAFLEPPGHRVVEIGPGGGVLTRELLATGASVVAWELDLGWALSLSQQADLAGAQIVVGDAEELDWTRLAPATLVAGNLPYAIATALIERLVRSVEPERVPRAAFLVQREVAERLTATPGEPAFGSFSLVVASCADVRFLGRVARGSFRPAPKVEGAFVGLRLKEPPVARNELPELLATIRAAFAHRRKTLRNSLTSRYGSEVARAACEALHLGPRVRAESLGLEEFVALHQTLKNLTE